MLSYYNTMDHIPYAVPYTTYLYYIWKFELLHPLRYFAHPPTPSLLWEPTVCFLYLCVCFCFVSFVFLDSTYE